MTIGDWLRSRTPQPPAPLAERIADVMGDAMDAPAESLPERCIAAAEQLVADLLARDNTSRDSALDLLTADALATYAFEAASEHPDSIARRAESAMERIAALGTVRPVGP